MHWNFIGQLRTAADKSAPSQGGGKPPHSKAAASHRPKINLAGAAFLGYSLPLSATELLKRITTSPEICHGKPCVHGLRYPVEWLLELLSGPTTEAEILADYPDLEPDDLRAAKIVTGY